MNTDEIKLLFTYSAWADDRILVQCAKLSHEQYAAVSTIGISFGSMRGTLVHLVDGIWQWRITCEGYYAKLLTDAEYLATELTEDQYPTLKSLLERWVIERQKMTAYVNTLTDEQLNGVLRYTLGSKNNPDGVIRERIVWHCLFQLINHSTQHRSEAAALLTIYAHSPGDMDFTLFLNEYYHLPD